MARNLTWHRSDVTAAERAAQLGQRPVTIWFTGLSGAGKSTLAFGLDRGLHELGVACFVLDGDNVRHGLNRDLGFGAEARKENIRRIAEVARLFNDAGLVVVTAFISPYRADRRLARQTIGADRFVEAWLSADVHACEQRDPKGLYRKAREGTLPDFTGISAPYEAPEDPELVLDTGILGVDECLARLVADVAARVRRG
ncbi:MAG: adenylyl-sulfate kinase [Betaproteobacteria bacterium]|nr:adenylyl-sulfate kinase [Betaproteobacteria bacterium]